MVNCLCKQTSKQINNSLISFKAYTAAQKWQLQNDKLSEKNGWKVGEQWTLFTDSDDTL